MSTIELTIGRIARQWIVGERPVIASHKNGNAKIETTEYALRRHVVTAVRIAEQPGGYDGQQRAKLRRAMWRFIAAANRALEAHHAERRRRINNRCDAYKQAVAARDTDCARIHAHRVHAELCHWVDALRAGGAAWTPDDWTAANIIAARLILWGWPLDEERTAVLRGDLFDGPDDDPKGDDPEGLSHYELARRLENQGFNTVEEDDGSSSVWSEEHRVARITGDAVASIEWERDDGPEGEDDDGPEGDDDDGPEGDDDDDPEGDDDDGPEGDDDDGPDGPEGEDDDDPARTPKARECPGQRRIPFRGERPFDTWKRRFIHHIERSDDLAHMDSAKRALRRMRQDARSPEERAAVLNAEDYCNCVEHEEIFPCPDPTP